MTDKQKTRQAAQPIDISEIKVDLSLPRKQRIEAFLAQLGEECTFRSGKLTVRLCFDENGAPLEELLARQLQTL